MEMVIDVSLSQDILNLFEAKVWQSFTTNYVLSQQEVNFLINRMKALGYVEPFQFEIEEKTDKTVIHLLKIIANLGPVKNLIKKFKFIDHL